jgi:hypothetical protein
MDGIPVSLLDGIGVVGFVGLIGWLIATGRWVPRKTYEDKEHEASEWRTEARIKDQQIHELTEQNTAMLREFGPTVADLLRGIRRQADAVEEEST